MCERDHFTLARPPLSAGGQSVRCEGPMASLEASGEKAPAGAPIPRRADTSTFIIREEQHKTARARNFRLLFVRRRADMFYGVLRLSP